MAAPGKVPIKFVQGDEVSLPFRLRDSLGNYLDLTGKVGKAQIRKTAAGPDVLAEFTVTIEQDVQPGQFRMFLSAADSALVPVGIWVYDLEIANADGTGRRTWMAGTVKCMAGVTR